MIAIPQNHIPISAPKPDNPPDATRSRSELLGDMIRQRDQRERIGAGLPLYVHLTLNEQGVMTGTYDQLGEVIGEKGNTIRNWVATMKTNEIITCDSKGRQVEVALTPDYMRIAKATDRVVEIIQAEHVETPRMRSIRKIVEVVDQVQGTLEFNVKI